MPGIDLVELVDPAELGDVGHHAASTSDMRAAVWLIPLSSAMSDIDAASSSDMRAAVRLIPDYSASIGMGGSLVTAL